MLNHVMFMLHSNEPVKEAHLHKLANQSMLYDALVINSFCESEKNFCRLIRQGTF